MGKPLKKKFKNEFSFVLFEQTTRIYMYICIKVLFSIKFRLILIYIIFEIFYHNIKWFCKNNGLFPQKPKFKP